MSKNTLLLRDQSELSAEVERYLIEKNIKYDVLYSDDEDMPCIFPPASYSSFKGSVGFNMFKYIHDRKKNVNEMINGTT
jgi:hypothetical protein